MKSNSILKVHTPTEQWYVEVPKAIEMSRNLSENAVAWAKEVFKDVTLVQFSKEAPLDLLACRIDIINFEVPMWKFDVYVPGISADINLQDDDNIAKVESWLDTHIYNMHYWSENT